MTNNLTLANNVKHNKDICGRRGEKANWVRDREVFCKRGDRAGENKLGGEREREAERGQCYCVCTEKHRKSPKEFLKA